MALDLRLQHKMSQQLVMTPQLQQAIKLLSLSHVEMAQAMREELGQNPVLEERDGPLPAPATALGDNLAVASAAAAHGAASPAGEGAQERTLGQVAGEGAAADEPVATADLVHATEPLATNYGPKIGTGGDGLAQERLPAAGLSLAESLCQQLQFVALTALQRQLAAGLIEALDADGYLPPDIVAALARANACTEGEVAHVLTCLQDCEPLGVGARSLSECLALQAQQLADAPPLLLPLIERYLPQVAARKWGQLARSLRTTPEEVARQARRIASLQPRPGRAFESALPVCVVPDLFVEATGHDNPPFAVWTNSEGLPRLALNPDYATSRTEHWPQQARSYVHDKLRAAQWLLRSVHMRQRTMLRVMRSIVGFQRAFFDHGVDHLRPMVLRDVAAALSMHESTISRVTSNKYVHTPHGTFELKFFFSSPVRSAKDDGEARASQSVRQTIERLIDHEDKTEPLSDQKIVELLLRQDIRIARRTVAKYRKMLNRQPSSSRRREL